MKFYLHEVSEWMYCKKCALVLDRYPSLIADSTKEEANRLGIQLIEHQEVLLTNSPSDLIYQTHEASERPDAKNGLSMFATGAILC